MSKRWLWLLLLVVWIGRGGVARAAFNATPDPLDVGSTNVGAPKTATGSLTNNAPLLVTLLLGSGGDCSQFAITSTTPLTIDNGSSNNVTVRLTPTSTGAKTCTVTVKKQSDGSVVGMFDVAGTATQPQISVTAGPLDFMHVEVGKPSPTQTITATNMGDGPLMITAVTFSANATSYVVAGTTGAQAIAPGDHFDWMVACKPATRGVVDSMFQIASNAPTGTASVTLTCVGDQGVLMVDQSPLDFGATLLNSTKTLPLVLSNPGNVAVTGITGVFDRPTAGYSVDATTPVPTMLAGNTSTTLMIKFAPTVAATDGGPAKITFGGTWGAGNPVSAVTNLAGQTVSLVVAPTTLPFGNFRFDSPVPQTFTIKNNGSAAVPIESVILTADLGTDPTELPFTIKLGAATVTLPASVPAGMQFDVTVTARPTNRTGLIGGKLVVHSSLTGLADQTVTVTGNATAAAITATAMVDFGAVDIDVARTAPPKMMAMIMNTGTATLDVSQVTASIAGTAGVFTFTNALPTTPTPLAPNTTLVFEATYKPTAERGPGDFDKVVLSADLTGALGGLKTQMITIQGRGIDRTLVIPAMPTFPPTFRNPGDTAPIRAITVHNNGEALLKITAAMISGEPVWRLMDKNPVDIAGNTSHDFLVQFAPSAVGPAPTGQLTLTSNDDHNVMKVITLNGDGMGRNVAFGPTTGVVPPMIDLGTTGVGIAFTADDILAVTNMDSATAFTIHDIVLDDTKTFHLVTPPADVELPASAKKLFAVTFDPKDVGDFTTTATLHLDQDPEVQSTVQITGHAVFVEAHGGGGCDAGGTGRGGGLAIGLAALGVIGQRRRSRAQRVAS
jgi:hypothetical protein